MKYSNDIVEKVVARLLSGEIKQVDLEKALNIPRKTLSRWIKRNLAGLPARFMRQAKRVWNKTIQPTLEKMRSILEQGKSTTLTWLTLNKTCLRTVQRYKKQWFPLQLKQREKIKRYERRKVYSLMHTDWGVKRILNGVRCCFSFYEDDASRKLFALKAYSNATLVNTINNLQQAIQETGGFKALLSDNGKQYHKNFDVQLHGIKHIRTRIHNPKCNGKAEAIVKKIKRYLNQFEVQNLEHANWLFKQFQYEYNNTPHLSLKYKTPNQIFSDKQKNGVICVVT